MTDQQKPDRPQTLLEAAKAATSPHDSYAACAVALSNLRAAIAREEAKPAGSEQIEGLKIAHAAQRDRAQQAESTAAWHKAESERLSAELAKAKESAAHLEKLRVEANELASYWALNYSERTSQWKQRAEKAESDLADQIVQSARWRAVAEKAEAELAVVKADCDTHRINAHEAAAAANCAPHDVAAEVLDLRQRAEKAEAEAARWKAHADEAETAVASCWIAAAAMRERAEKAEEEIAHVRKALGAADGELTWMAAEKRVNMHHAAVGGCETLQGEYRTWRDRAEKAEAELAKARQDRQLDRAVDALTKIEPRDPTTGFTFATYRRLLEALGGKS